MCSVEETDFPDEEPSIIEMTPSTDDSSIPTDELCKCSTDKPVAIKIGLKDGQCIDCFLKSVRHKFRATLGSTKCIPRGSAVMIVHNGRPESFVLLDVVKNAVDEETFKRIHLQPHVLYIDETIAPTSDSIPSNICEKVKRQLSKYEFPLFYTSIWSDTVISLNDTETESQLNEQLSFQTAYQSISDQTSRYEFLQIKRKNCIRQSAEKLKCNYAFVSDIGPDLATTFLTNIVLGRGNSVAHDVSLIDRRSTVQIIRPIRDLNYREVEMYIKFSGIMTLEGGDLRSADDQVPAGSVQALTMNFVNGLQSNFSSTVSTVFKTGDKMHAEMMEKLNLSDRKCCQFCLSDLDRTAGSTTLAAIDYSRIMSLNGNRIDVDGSSVGKLKDVQLASNKTLCHSCQNIIKDVKDHSFANFLIPCDD